MLELIASTMALAIENRRLSEKAYSSILVALQEVSEMLLSKEIMPFSALCDRIVRKCIEIFNAQACSLYLETPGTDPRDPSQTITMVAGAGYEVHRIGKATYKKGQCLTGCIWERSQSVKYDTTEQLESRHGPWKGVHDDMIRQKVPDWVCSSLIGVPLRIGTRTIGVIKVENKNPARHAHFSHEELRSLEILASNIALALEMLNRHREIFWQGERARGFFHNISNQFQNALLQIRQAKDDLRTCDESHIGIVQERLLIVEKTLTDLEQLQKQTLKDKPAGPHRKPTDVKRLVLDLLERSDRLLGEKAIEVETHWPEETVFANVDRDQILQALGNTLANAIEALANRTAPRIWIEVKVEDRHDRKEVAIAIVDNGPGLTHDQRDRFRQAGRIPSTKHPGAGAGLAEASRCCMDSGGHLELFEASLPRSGGAFRILLPPCKPHLLRLAVIDDDENIISSFKLACQTHHDVQAVYFTSPDCLFSAGGDDRGDVNPTISENDFVLLDCHFDSGLDGSQVFRELTKAHNVLADKIILMSGYEEVRSNAGVKVYDKFSEILANFDVFVAMLHARRSIP